MSKEFIEDMQKLQKETGGRIVLCTPRFAVVSKPQRIECSNGFTNPKNKK